MTTSFNELINTSTLPVFADFWAEWCGPCHAVAPAVKQLASEFKGKLLVVKINVDEKPQIAAEYGIRGIPALKLFKGGKIVWEAAGALPYDQLKAQVSEHL